MNTAINHIIIFCGICLMVSCSENNLLESSNESKNKPSPIQNLTVNYEFKRELIKCYSRYYYGEYWYEGTCKSYRQTTLSWNKGTALGVVISVDPGFSPVNGNDYKTGDNRVFFASSSSNSCYFKDNVLKNAGVENGYYTTLLDEKIYINRRTVTFYVYSFDTDLNYPITGASVRLCPLYMHPITGASIRLCPLFMHTCALLQSLRPVM